MNKDHICLHIIGAMGEILNTYLSYNQCQREYFENSGIYYEKEVHILKYIIDNPNKTLTEIAKKTSRSKSSVSQVIKRLVEKELLHVEQDAIDKRKMTFTPTEKGYQLDNAHRKYDFEMAKFLSKFLTKYTEDEINLFLDLLKKYNDFQNEGYSLKDIKKTVER